MLRRVLALAIAFSTGFGCRPNSSVGGSPGSLAVDLGTIDAGETEAFRVKVPASEEVLRELEPDATITPSSNFGAIRVAKLDRDSVTFEGMLLPVANTSGFQSQAIVMKKGEPTMILHLKAKVRRVFKVQALVDGKRYLLKMLPGRKPPTVVDRSEGVVAKVVSTGKDTAELRVSRTLPPRVPGGMVRLVDRPSGDSQVVLLPMPFVEVSSHSVGRPLDSNGRFTIGSNSGLTQDKKDVEVVLDPPGGYEIVSRGYKNGILNITLQSITRRPADVTVGFRRHGKWVEIQRYQMD